MNSKTLRWTALAILLSLTAACEGRMNLRADDTASGEPSVETEAPAEESDGENPTAVIDDQQVELAEARMIRLTNAQYRNSVRAAFGDDITFETDLPPDEKSELFRSIGASKVGTSSRGVELYQESALDIADQVLQNADQHAMLADCAPSGPQDPCVAEAIGHYGKQLWRRSLTEEEVGRFAGIVAAAGEEPDQLSLGLKYAIAGLLASPNFIYVPIEGELDEEVGARRYTGLEMASRLAFFIWNAPPDEALIAAAENGGLADAEGIRAQARRMLEDPKARSLPGRFFGQNWNVSGLTAGLHSSEIYPEWNEALAADYEREFELVLEDIVFDRDADLFEVFTGESTFANQRIADVYGVDVEGDGWVNVPLGEGRSGLLTSGAVVAANSTSENFLPTYRGVFIMERMLCQTPPAPPPGAAEAAAEQEPSDEPQTTREIVESHASDPACAGCHAAFDPMGFTYEHFDRVGRYQQQQNGRPVDAVGDVYGTQVDGVPELADWLAQDSRTSRCISDRLYTFANGRHPLAGEEAVLAGIDEDFVDGGRHFKDLVVSVVSSPGFRFFASE